MMIGYIGRRPALGGPIALVRDGDIIRIDGHAGTSNGASTTPRSRAAVPTIARDARSAWPGCWRSTHASSARRTSVR
jgi:dihydroxyacid dehydratase/phosphogluconate dehydratase